MSDSNSMSPLVIFKTQQGAPVLINFTHVTHITGMAEKGSCIHLTNGAAIEVTEPHENVVPTVMKQAMAMASQFMGMAQEMMAELG